MSSLLEGIDIKPHGQRGDARKKCEDDRKGVKLAVVVVCFVAAGALMAWNFGLFDSAPGSGSAGVSAGGTMEGAAPPPAPAPRGAPPKITDLPPANSPPARTPTEFSTR